MTVACFSITKSANNNNIPAKEYFKFYFKKCREEAIHLDREKPRQILPHMVNPKQVKEYIDDG